MCFLFQASIFRAMLIFGGYVKMTLQVSGLESCYGISAFPFPESLGIVGPRFLIFFGEFLATFVSDIGQEKYLEDHPRT